MRLEFIACKYRHFYREEVFPVAFFRHGREKEARGKEGREVMAKKKQEEQKPSCNSVFLRLPTSALPAIGGTPQRPKSIGHLGNELDAHQTHFFFGELIT